MLEIRNLRVRYGHDTVLDGIDLSLSRGETLAIIGESGMGKTTLGMSIMRLVKGTVQGSILFDGRDFLTVSEEEMRRIRWNRVAMAFQNVNNVLNPVVSVLEQVAEPMIEHGLRSEGEARERARGLLERFGLSRDRFSAYPHQLSGGEQQRVLLAMAWANDPELLILDEPLSSLDVATRTQLADLLRQDSGRRARLVVTHDLDTASSLADRLAVLYGGRVVEVGCTHDVLRYPRHPYSRALIRASPNMTTVKDLQGIKGRMMRPVSGCPFHPRCTQAVEVCSRETPALIADEGREIACHRGGIVTLLSTTRLTKSFGGRKVLDSVSLRIEHGETVALVGQSGSGKSTLAKTIMGLYLPEEGAVYLEGAQVDGRNKDFYRAVQMVSQNPGESLSHRLTVLEAVREPLDVLGTGTREEREHKVRQVLSEVELPQTDAFVRRYPHQLSGGELQRVVIARALVLGPRLLIADEPTAFLDASVQAKILKLLLNLQEQRGLAMLFITHDIAVARKVSDRIAVMLDGKIVEEGPSHEIVANPRHAYTRSLLEAISTLNLGKPVALDRCGGFVGFARKNASQGSVRSFAEIEAE